VGEATAALTTRQLVRTFERFRHLGAAAHTKIRPSMRITALGLALSSLLFVPTAEAVRGNEPAVVTNGRPQRAHRTVELAPRDRMFKAGLAGWRAQLDRDTGVPLRMWGAGPVVPGSVVNAAIAESAAKAFLAANLALLAPGANASDFVVVANRETNGIRSVGFEQQIDGLRVVGGSIGFAFQSDRLALVGSTALPNVRVPTAGAVSRGAAATTAERWLANEGYAARTRAGGDQVVYPVVHERTAHGLDITYHLAHELSIDDRANHAGWKVWVDVATGKPIARRSTVSRGTGKVLYNVPVRGAQGTRADFPAQLVTVNAGGTSLTSNLTGDLTFAGNGPVNVDVGFTGPLVQINDADGIFFTSTQALANGGTATFASADPLGDAQLATFVHVNLVKQFAKRVDPALAFLDTTQQVFVNENDVCNAFADFDNSIHFFKGGQGCENTGRIADVIYHEFGHLWHGNTVIPGVGEFEGAVSEGMSDVTSILLTNDARLGPGFFVDKPDEGLRNLDPAGFEKKFPLDATGEVHDDGEIIAGTFVDLDRALQAKLGAGPGRLQLEKLFLTVLQRSTGLASAYAETLLGDDNDGNLANGTPNKCEIDAAFAAHGLADEATTLGAAPPTRDGFNFTAPVAVDFTGACSAGALEIAKVEVEFGLRGEATEKLELTKGGSEFTGAIPTQLGGSVVQYRVIYTLTNGTFMAFPSSNAADKFFEFYVGPVREIQCFDFEDGAQGWTLGDQWEVGAPQGLAGDPEVANGGQNVLGVDLGNDGFYDAEGDTFAESPEIDLKGAKKVRLQFHRWLTVVDGFLDSATIEVNNQPMFENVGLQPGGGQGITNHTDREWRFKDIDLSAVIPTGKVKLKFGMEPHDQFGFPELGGWNIDDVCVVEVVDPSCGDTFLDAGEVCDDGNATNGDGCSATCEVEVPEPDDGGCCSTGGSPVAPAGFTALVGLGLLRRRRRK
jgi:MYXO-CTERM domain-containing protein